LGQGIWYSTEGVYLTAVGGSSDVPEPIPGLWLLDPQTSRVALIEGSHFWATAANGAAWAVDPPSTADGSYTVYRLDLASGQIASWYQSKTSIGLLSPTADGGLLIRYEVGGLEGLAVLAGPDLFMPLDLSPDFGGEDGGHLGQPGIWISLTNGVALYAKGEGLRIMARSPYGYSFFPAGGCE
jgi:hypothetical protein